MHKLDELLNYPLKQDQYQYVDFALKHHYCIVAAQMGVGKTVIGISMALHTGGRIVVVCPAFLKITWADEFETFSKESKKIVVVNGSNAHKINPEEWDVIILNYAILGKCSHLFLGAKTVIADEAHYLLNPKAKRTKSMYSYIQKSKPKRFIMLTGTPNKGKGQQWFMPIKLCVLNPWFTSGKDMPIGSETYWAFQHMFCNKVILNIGGRTVTQFEGIKNVPRLKELLKGKLIRGKYEGQKDIELIKKSVLVQYTSKFDNDLAHAWESFEEGKRDEHVMSTKASSALAKVPFTIEYVSNMVETGETPVIVYTDHLASLVALVDGFKKLRVAKVCGSTPTDKRDVIKKAFQNGEYDVLCATITAYNTGVTLTKSWNIVMNDENWDYTHNDQAYHRIYRIGQTRDCIIHKIFGSKTDKMISKNVEKRKGITDAVLEEL